MKVTQAPGCIRALWDFAVMVNRQNTEGRRSIALYESALRTFNLIKGFTCFLCIAIVLFVTFPVYNLLVMGKPTLLLSLDMPFVNRDTIRGFIVTIAFQALISIYAIAGNMAFDLFLAMIVSNYQGIVSIWECQLEELVVLYKRKETKKNIAYRRAFLKNVYLQLIDATELFYSYTLITVNEIKFIFF